MTRAFVENEVNPVAARMDREGAYPAELVNKMAEMGLMGVFVPQEYGGSGMDVVSYVVAMEEISKAWASLGVIMSVNNSLVCAPILRFGSVEQKKKYLPSLARGERLGCYSLTEPGSGSDAGSIQTRAKRAGNDYVLNGNKVFTTNGSRADLAIVYAVTEPASGKKGISAFIVEKSTPGFIVGPLEDKLGLRSSDTASLVFEECRVPQENLLGNEGDGFRIALETLDGGRVGIAAQALGIAQGCLDESLAYAKQRWQFGRPIAEFQATQMKVAEMATELDAARLLVYRAAWKKDTAAERVTLESETAADVGTGGRFMIQGTVIFPSGHRVDRPLKIRLSTPMRGEISTITDTNGSFSFRRLSPGSYTIIIDGTDDYEAVNERTNIIQAGRSMGSTEEVIPVQIRLKAKASVGIRPEVIHAELASVSKPAVDLYNSALKLARANLDAKNYRAASAYAAEVLSVDPNNAEATKIRDEARGMIARVDAAISRARSRVDAGDIPGAARAL